MDKKKKLSKQSAAPKIKDLDAKQRRLAIIKQKQCDTIALHLVNKLIDCAVEEDVLLGCLKYLNQSHYQDIVEERAISKLCGYPICANEIKNIPSKQYHISTKTNKVYDITDRKNYCSNFCYKAGIFIKEQMLTSPLWFRDQEEIPSFHLLPKTENGIPGQEIDQGLVKIDLEDQTFTSVSQFTEDMINEIPENMCNEINIEGSSTAVVSETEKQENIEKNEEKVNQYFANLYAPSLADILKENAEYFKNDNNINGIIKNCDNSLENKVNKNVNETLNIIKSKVENKSTEKENKTNNENINNIKPIPKDFEENCKIGFNRTIINTKSKGILKKSADYSSEKKRVTFSAENSEIEIINNVENEEVTNKIYKKPEKSKTEENEKRYKNINVIDNVQERCTSSNSTTEENQRNKDNNINSENVEKRETKTIEIKEVVEHTFKEPEISKITESNNKNNNFDTLTENPASDNQNIENENISPNTEIKNKETNKEKRLSRLKNSSLYKKTNLISKPVSVSKNSTFSDLKSKINSCIEEWFTIETVLFIYGEDYVKKLVSEKSFKHFLNKKKNLELNEKQQKKFDDICKQLNMMELADQKFDESVTGKKRRPLPNYKNLREEAEKMELKVQAFYSGCYEIYDEEVNTDTESVNEEDNEDKPYIEKGPPAVLPLVDNKDLMGTRRRIFLTSISRIIPEICELLRESPNNLLTELKHLINTFEFTAKNIVFKTNEWQLVTILLVQILSIRDQDLQKSLSTTEVSQFLKNVGNQFDLEKKFVDELLNKTQIQNNLEKCMKKSCLNDE